MALHPTRNDLATRTRSTVCDLLNARLADAIHDVVEGQVDELAERITALGGVAAGTVAAVARASTLAAYPRDIVRGADHLDALAQGLAAYGGGLRKAIGGAGKAGDDVTADLFTGMTADIDKQLWLVEAHLQADS